MEYVPCIGNSSYSFWRILLKLYRCFKDGLEICILFFQSPEIIFYHFFRIFNLDIFRALILQICIWSIYLVSATPPTVFGESFWNFTVVFRMVWRYAYCFLRILKLFFLHFNLDIFSSLYATDMYREYMPCIGNPAYSFRPILLKLYRYFAAFLWFHMRNLSLAGYNCSGGASCMACSFIFVMFVPLSITKLCLLSNLKVKKFWISRYNGQSCRKAILVHVQATCISLQKVDIAWHLICFLFCVYPGRWAKLLVERLHNCLHIYTPVSGAQVNITIARYIIFRNKIKAC